MSLTDVILPASLRNAEAPPIPEHYLFVWEVMSQYRYELFVRYSRKFWGDDMAIRKANEVVIQAMRSGKLHYMAIHYSTRGWWDAGIDRMAEAAKYADKNLKPKNPKPIIRAIKIHVKLWRELIYLNVLYFTKLKHL